MRHSILYTYLSQKIDFDELYSKAVNTIGDDRLTKTQKETLIRDNEYWGAEMAMHKYLLVAEPDSKESKKMLPFSEELLISAILAVKNPDAEDLKELAHGKQLEATSIAFDISTAMNDLLLANPEVVKNIMECNGQAVALGEIRKEAVLRTIQSVDTLTFGY